MYTNNIYIYFGLRQLFLQCKAIKRTLYYFVSFPGDGSCREKKDHHCYLLLFVMFVDIGEEGGHWSETSQDLVPLELWRLSELFIGTMKPIQYSQGSVVRVEPSVRYIMND